MSLRLSRPSGFSFIEVMVSLSVLSIGLVAILQTFVISMDRMSYLTNRLYASVLLDNKLAIVERILRAHNALPFQMQEQEECAIGYKKVLFDQSLKIGIVQNLSDIFSVELSVSWKEKNRVPKVSNTMYVARFKD